MNTKENFNKRLEMEDYIKLKRIGIVYNITCFNTWCPQGNLLRKNFKNTFNNKKMWKWFIDNFIHFIYFDIPEINRCQKLAIDDVVTYEDNVIIHMTQFYISSIYRGNTDIAH